MFVNKIKRFFMLSAFLFVSSSLFAFDFGGVLTNDSAFENYGSDKLKIDQKNGLSVWFTAPFDKSGENLFAFEGTYNFESDFENEEITNALDVNLLSLSLSKQIGASSSSKIGFTLGRFYFSDKSGLVFSQNADGLKLFLQNNYISFSVYGSYTGFLNALNTKIINKTPDTFMLNGTSPVLPMLSDADNDKVYDFADKYAVLDLSLSFPYLFLNQNITLEALSTFHVEDEKYNRTYATFAIDGPIYRSFFYSLGTTFGFSQYENAFGEDKREVSNLSNLRLDYYLKNASFGATLVYASGNQGGLSPFVGFTKITSTYSLQDFLYSGIAKLGLDALFKPVENVLLTLGFDSVFNAVSGDSFDGFEYYGFQYSLGATWQAKSDLQFALIASQFFDKDNTDFAKKTYIDLHIALSF